MKVLNYYFDFYKSHAAAWRLKFKTNYASSILFIKVGRVIFSISK